MPEISLNGETIHYRRDGSGPTLLMLHSLGTNSYLWEAQITQLKDRFTCIAMDARGHGKSTNNGGATMHAIAEDAHALLSALGLLPAHIMGISMGALQCARLHAIDPAAVLSVTYVDSFSFMGEAGPERVQALTDKMNAMTMDAYAKDYADDTLLPTTAKGHHDALVAAISGMTKDDYLDTVRSVFTEDVRDQLKGIDKPTHIVVGDKDQRTPLAAAESVHALVAGSTLEVIPDAAHLANIDNPTGFTAAVEPFLNRVRG